MNRGSYSFELGDFKRLAISDGAHAYTEPAETLFANAPPEKLQQALRKHGVDLEDWQTWANTYTALLIDTGQHLVLVDTGAGDDLCPNTGKLIKNLRAQGIEPADINTVILTHAHPDHVGGNMGMDGEVTFPNARFYMCRDEWDFWLDPDPAIEGDLKDILLAAARTNLPPIQDHLTLIDRETQIIPGITLWPTPGHTPGHLVPIISSRGEQLLCIGDVAVHLMHLEHPDWHMAVDVSPTEALDSRRKVLDRAAADRSLVLGFHFPFPGLGHITRDGEGWQWHPVVDRRPK